MGELTLLAITLRLGLAVVFGGIIGMNRGKKKMPAGFRTHILVCMGAALTMITNQYICQLDADVDLARMGAQVISGIGFLGAGTIIVTGRNKVKGLTTAASLWVSGCMGLAIGIGLYGAAIIACIYMLFVMVVLQKIDEWMVQRSRSITLYIEFSTIENVREFLAEVRGKGIIVQDLDIGHIHEINNDEVSAVMTIRIPKRVSHIEVIHQLSQYKGIRYMQEM
ncbi:MAG: MgtC/SapB family protein [Cellulosilyticaceae bacterium]